MLGKKWRCCELYCIDLASYGLRYVFTAQCSFMEYKNFKIVFRRYASLYFIIGVDNTEVSVHFIVCRVYVDAMWHTGKDKK